MTGRAVIIKEAATARAEGVAQGTVQAKGEA